jgi:glycosyltransferase involved in cell wall biosynthesis
MSDTPKLAIVIACYNYDAFVVEAIRSVLDQGRHDCELVVVDDGSTDQSWEAIQRTGANSFRIPNGGARRACLFGLDRTKAPFVLFLDADDLLKPGSIATIICRLDPAVAKLQFSLTRVDAHGEIISSAFPALGSFRDRDGMAREVLRNGVYQSSPTSGNVFRRDVCELLREAEYDSFVDGVTLFAAPFFGDIVSLSEELGCYRIHGANDSGLGRAPDPTTFERDIHRYLARMDHLRNVIQRLEPGHTLFDPRRTFYFRERQYFVEISSGRRPAITALMHLLGKLAAEPLPAKSKAALAIFYVFGAVLPDPKRKALLAYRLQAGDRTALGFLNVVAGRRS